MPGFVPVPGVAQFNFQYSSYGNVQENVLHVRHKDLSAWTTAQLSAMNNIMINWDSTVQKLYRVSDFSLVLMTAKDLTTQPAAFFQTTTSSPGTLGADACPESVTIAIKKGTGLTGRSQRGRWFWVGLSKSKQVGDRYDQTTCINMVNALNTLLSTINGTTNCEAVIVQRFANKVALNPALAHPITEFDLVDNIIDSQRRRLMGHNRHR